MAKKSKLLPIAIGGGILALAAGTKKTQAKVEPVELPTGVIEHVVKNPIITTQPLPLPITLTPQEKEDLNVYVNKLVSFEPRAIEYVDEYNKYLDGKVSFMSTIAVYENTVADIPAKESYINYLEGNQTHESYIDDYKAEIGVTKLPAEQAYNDYLAGDITYKQYREAYDRAIGIADNQPILLLPPIPPRREL